MFFGLTPRPALNWTAAPLYVSAELDAPAPSVIDVVVPVARASGEDGTSELSRVSEKPAARRMRPSTKASSAGGPEPPGPRISARPEISKLAPPTLGPGLWIEPVNSFTSEVRPWILGLRSATTIRSVD